MTELVIEVQRLDGGTLRIRHAAEMAQVFFRLDRSSAGENSYDHYIQTNQQSKDAIVRDDIDAANRSMAAWAFPSAWEELMAPTTLPWLRNLDTSWQLFDLTDQTWEHLKVEETLTGAFENAFGYRRRLAVVTKVLHIKRPELIPVCDRLVLEQVGAPLGIGQNPARSADFIGYLRREGRRNLYGLRAIQEQLGADGLSRSQVRIFEALLWASHPETRFPNVEPLIGRWVDGVTVVAKGIKQ